MSHLPDRTLLAVTDEEVDELAWQELAAAARFIARSRVVILPVLLSLIGLATALDPAPWRLWLLVTVGALGLAVAVRDFLWLRQRTLRPQDIPYLLALVVTMQAMAITITGGVESPILPILIPVALLPAIVLGGRRIYLHFVVLPLSVVWFLTLAGAFGWLSDLTPNFFSQGVHYASNATYTVTRACVYTLAIGLGGGVAVLLRRGFRQGARAAAAARLELLESTRQQNRDLMTLSSEIAHELKNPLASIQGLASLLSQKLPEGSRESQQMSVLLAEVKRMGTTLEEFLTFSRPLQGLALQAVSPAHLARQVVAMHEGLAHRRKVRLRAETDESPEIRCDPRKVTQALVNLVQNALEATPAKGEVVLRTERTGGGTFLGVTFLVEDTGPGLDPSLVGRLFRPGVTTKPEGSGLGLVIARAIAEQHGGTLVLEGRQEGGCRARLALPAAPSEATVEGASPSTQPLSQATHAPKPPPTPDAEPDSPRSEEIP